MTPYVAPLKDMAFVLRNLVDLDHAIGLRKDVGLSEDVVTAALEQAGRFAETVFAPLYESGDRAGLTFENGEVTTPPGYRDAYRQFVESGWHTLAADPHYGGQGFPLVVSALVQEMWRASNIALTGCMTLTAGAIEALETRASQELKDLYLPHLVTGEWTGTMNLTEPQAGSDLSAIRSRGEPQPDGSYRVFGQKIFISWGRHDLSDNIIHLVLALVPGAPEGVKGLSMFLVPEKLLDAQGRPARHNDVQCASIEHKVGQHSAPSTTMIFGAGEVEGGGVKGAIGYLVGERDRGLEIMFIMMNNARFGVGLEGLATADRCYQTALAYAKERVQGSEVGGVPGVKVPIIRHPDVRRMLMRMKAASEGMRALTVVIAAALDSTVHGATSEERAKSLSFVDLMTPVYKAWNTETAANLTALGVQIHGGLGYMEDCAAAQHWRDARILTIYEGTTGIQSNDLVGRKIARDQGAAARLLAADIRGVAAELSAETDLAPIGLALGHAAEAIDAAVDHVLANYADHPQQVLAVAVSIMTIFGIASVGWQLGRSALAARRELADGSNDRAFLSAKIATARFFADHWISEIEGLLAEIANGGSAVLVLSDEQF